LVGEEVQRLKVGRRGGHVSQRIIAVLFLLLTFGTAGQAEPWQEKGGDTRLEDGDILRCVTEGKGGWEGSSRPEYASAEWLRRMPSEFRVRYNAPGTADADTAASIVTLSVLGNALPLFEQVHFPGPVEPPSSTFLRTGPRVFMLFQLDPWHEGEAGFSWAERHDETSIMAYGRCMLADRQ
jgi:hypothetical protein